VFLLIENMNKQNPTLDM